MQRRVAVIASAAFLVPAAGVAALVAQAADPSGGRHTDGRNGQRFVGYWMGIDPLDGGDSRRAIARETVTRRNGEPVDEIVFHRVSAR